MPLSPQANDFMSCPICFTHFSYQRKPITLVCSHSICSSCLKSLTRCPFDQTVINTNLPENEAILCLVAGHNSSYGGGRDPARPLSMESFGLSKEDSIHYYKAIDQVKQLAAFLKPHQSNGLSRPMQRKLISLLHCQIVEGEGRSRAMRNVRSIGERALSELLIKHQDPHSLSANLWAAVRARGCQFLGPAMQEEVLRLVLLALEDGSALSRKVLVMFVVQRLSPHFPHQASKTAIGHVIQLLYRASCFKLTKREGDSSLMQLKEEYCVYEALRREHDTQIVSIALEAGLRISPDQWSSVLYGDTAHKSHMQSIIDKLQSPQSFNQSIQELVIALQRTNDPGNLARLREHFEKLAQIDSTPATESSHPTLAELASYLESCRIISFSLVDFLDQVCTGAYRSGRNFSGAAKPGRSSRPNKAAFSSANGSGNGQRIGPTVSPLQQQTNNQQQQEQQQQQPLLNPNFLESSQPQFRFPKRGPTQRPCASVPPTRIGQVGSSPNMLDLSLAPQQPMTPIPIIPMVNAPPPVITGPPMNTMNAMDQGPGKGYLQPMATVPVAIVDASGTPTGTAAVAVPVGPPPPFAPMAQVVPAPPDPQQATPVAPTAEVTPLAPIVPSLSSDDDQFIPFADHPFVSKYGPISRAMAIQTASILGSSNALMSNGNGTQSTNVILGRTAVPSLTFIQPLQQVMLTPTMVDPNTGQSAEQQFNDMIQASPVHQEYIHENQITEVSN